MTHQKKSNEDPGHVARLEKELEALRAETQRLRAENSRLATIRHGPHEFENPGLELLDTSRQLFTDIVLGIPVATVVIDAGHVITHWNAACESLTGLTAAQVIGTKTSQWDFGSKNTPMLCDLVVDNCCLDELQQQYGDSVRSSAIEGAYEMEHYFSSVGEGIWGFFTVAPIRDMTGAVAGAIMTIQDITGRKQLEDLLRQSHDELEKMVQDRTAAMQDANMALRVLLEKRDEDKRQLEETVITNIQELVLPQLERLKSCGLTGRAAIAVDTLMENFAHITKPLLMGKTLGHLKLTASELKIASLIRQKKTTREIAIITGLSPRTIDRHRDNIRKKLGLRNKSINLTSYLLSLS